MMRRIIDSSTASFSDDGRLLVAIDAEFGEVLERMAVAAGVTPNEWMIAAVENAPERIESGEIDADSAVGLTETEFVQHAVREKLDALGEGAGPQ